jgi:hypothetical protein
MFQPSFNHHTIWKHRASQPGVDDLDSQALHAERDLAETMCWDDLCGIQDAGRHLLGLVESAKDAHVTRDSRKRQRLESEVRHTGPRRKDVVTEALLNP